jgi:hypothetical protein
MMLAAGVMLVVQAVAQAPSIATVTDVDADARGRVYVADGRTGSIHVLDGRLRETAVVGRRGTRPGEYRELQAVRVIDSATFVAVERINRHLNVYRWNGGVPQLAASISVPFDPYDACPLPGGRFLVLGLHENHRLHEIDSRGKVVESRAPFDAGVAPVVAEHVVEGRMACTPDRDVVLTSAWLPRVEFFGDWGRIARDTRFLTPIRVMSVKSDSTGRRFSSRSGREGYHSPGRALPIGDLRMIGARVTARMDGVGGDSVRWYGYDRSRALARYVEAEGRVFPIGAGKALLVKEAGTVELQVVSLKDRGW